MFFDRVDDMFIDGTSGTTEANWSECTKTKLFMPLFDPSEKMKKLYFASKVVSNLS